MAFKLLVILTVLKLTLSNPYPGIKVEIDVHVDDSETKVKEETYDSENDVECNSQCPQTSNSRMFTTSGPCDLNKYAETRSSIVKELIENANQYQTTAQSTPRSSTPRTTNPVTSNPGISNPGTSNMNLNIFNAIMPIDVNQNLAEVDLINITNIELLKHLELNDPSYVTMKKLRAKWIEDPNNDGNLRQEFKDQIENVKAIKAINELAGPLFDNRITLQHIFQGEKKKKQRFTGLHDGSVFYNINEQGESEAVVGAHKIIGGIVKKVSHIGPGVAVDIANPQILWNGKTRLTKGDKGYTSIFLGVPPRFQAALYLTAFLEAPGAPCTTVTVINPENPLQEISIKVDNYGITAIKSGYPYFAP